MVVRTDDGYEPGLPEVIAFAGARGALVA
jgi:hypothetical protein